MKTKASEMRLCGPILCSLCGLQQPSSMGTATGENTLYKNSTRRGEGEEEKEEEEREEKGGVSQKAWIPAQLFH